MDESRIRVLVTAFAPVPGSNPHAPALIGMARALRAELDLVTVKTESLAHVEHFGDARMFRVPVTGAPEEQRGGFGRAIARQLEAQPYDVVHVRGPVEGLAVLGQRRQLGFRFVYEVATFPDEAEGPEAEAAWVDAHTRCLDEADLVLVPTEAAARSLGERGYAGKVAVVQPGVDVEVFDWWPAVHDEVVRLLYLGAFSADRDPGTLLGAIREVARRRPVRAMLAGEPDRNRRHRLRRMVEAFELGGVVEVRGEPRPQSLPFLIAAGDIGIVPAAATPRFQEGGDLPQPLLEYMACRRPVVAAGVPAVSEVVRDEKEGLVYLPGDESTLADAIETLLNEPASRDRLVEAAYDRVRWDFSGSARRRRIAEVYEMLVPGSQGYDSWNAAFELDATGQVALPDELIDGEGSSPPGSTTPPPMDDGSPFDSGETPYPPIDTSVYRGREGAGPTDRAPRPLAGSEEGAEVARDTGVDRDTGIDRRPDRSTTGLDEHPPEPTRIDPLPEDVQHVKPEPESGESPNDDAP